MKIFIINLPRSVERRQLMKKQLDRFNLDYEFVEAVDGAALTDEYIAANCDLEAIKKRPTWLTRGALGCAFSHYNVYQKIVDENIEKAVVFEDDMVLEEDFPEAIKEMEKVIKTNEVIMLYFTTTKVIELSTDGLFKIQNKYNLAYPLKVHPSMTAAAYVLTNQVANNLLNVIKPIRVTADQWKFFFEHGAFESMRCVYPHLVKSAYLKSSIDYVDSKTIVGRVLNLVDRYKLFPFAQYLKYRRKKIQLKMHNVRFTSQKASWIE